MLGKITDALGSVLGLVDDFVTSDEERLQLKAPLLEIQASIITAAVEGEAAITRARADVVIAEANSESWITRTWRPLTMLTFVTLIVFISTGIMDTEALGQIPDRMWSLLQIGIGGYMGSRGIEKTVSSVAGALKAREE